MFEMKTILTHGGTALPPKRVLARGVVVRWLIVFRYELGRTALIFPSLSPRLAWEVPEDGVWTPTTCTEISSLEYVHKRDRMRVLPHPRDAFACIPSRPRACADLRYPPRGLFCHYAQHLGPKKEVREYHVTWTDVLLCKTSRTDNYCR